MPARPLRVALISLHTSPLADAGAGDAGGMNIMVRHSAEAMAAVGHEVVVFTRRTDPHSPDVQLLAPRAVVHQLRAGPAAPVSKEHHEELIAPLAAVLAQHWADLGAGDAGGMNIMVRHSAEAMAAVGHEVVVFTRRTDPHSPDVQLLAPRAVVHQLRAGPAAPVSKEHHEELIAPLAAVLAQHWDEIGRAHV